MSERHIPFPKPFRAGPFEHPSGSGVWWVGYYDKESRPGDRSAKGHHRRSVKIGSYKDAVKFYESRCAEVAKHRHDVLWGTPEKTKKTASAISSSWTAKRKKGQSRRQKGWWKKKREEGYRRPPANDKTRDSRRINGLYTWTLEHIATARDAGRKKGVLRAADPKVRARSAANKMREQCAKIGVFWPDEQHEQLVRNLQRENKERLDRRPEKRAGRRPDPMYAKALLDVEDRGLTEEQATDKYLHDYYDRDPEGALHQMQEGLRRERERRHKRRAA